MGEPTQHWSRKMKTGFRHWDTNGRGYITKEDVMKRSDRLQEVCPNTDIEPLRQYALRFWIESCNLGLQVPEDYRLTESQYIQNMWKAIKQPSCVQLLTDMTMMHMEYLDTEKKGHISKEDYVKGAARFMKAEEASATFDHMSCDGKITAESMREAVKFYYTDTDSVDHPLNRMAGPLVDN